MNEQVKVALVTGASRGIGAAIAESLGATGIIVIGTATSSAGANAISERFSDLGIDGEGMVLNVTDADSIDAVLTKLVTNMALQVF